MKLIDFDGLFDEKLAIYMEKNKGKYTEKQWEDVIAKLYIKFGDTYVSRVKCTPKEYYLKMTDTELVESLKGHLEENVPVPSFLCDEIEKRNPIDKLIELLKSKDPETVSYAINLVGGDERAFDVYFQILTENLFDADMQDAVVDKLKENADKAKETALSYYKKGMASEFMLEILSKTTKRDEDVFNILCSAFLSDEDKIPVRAGYLASYGDDRALPILLKRIESREIRFVEFQELKYAIEALGGEYNEPRDFSTDEDFIMIGEASKKEGFSDENLKN